MIKPALFSMLVLLTLTSAAYGVEKVVVEPPSEELLKTRDPFKRPITATGEVDTRTEIEMFPSEQMKLVGVVSGPSRMRAMILAPNGKSYFIGEKQKIGVRKGIVKRITRESVLIQEKVINVLGKEESVDVELKLGASEIASGSP